MRVCGAARHRPPNQGRAKPRGADRAGTAGRESGVRLLASGQRPGRLAAAPDGASPSCFRCGGGGAVAARPTAGHACSFVCARVCACARVRACVRAFVEWKSGLAGQDGFTPLRLAHLGEHPEVMKAILDKEEEGEEVTLEEEWGRLAQKLVMRMRCAWFEHGQEGATGDLLRAGTMPKREHQRRKAAAFPSKMLYLRGLHKRFGAGSFAELMLLDMSPELREEVVRQAKESLRAGTGYLAESCAACGTSKEAGMLRCSRCARRGVTVRYCDAACQRAHWPAHKAECRE